MTTTFLPDHDDFDFGPRLWDADPDVCCAAFQLGACEHTEAFDGGYDDDLDLAAAPVPAPIAAPVVDDEPF